MSERKRRTIFNMLEGRCFYCGCLLEFNNFHMDHFLAASRGGKRESNLVPSCPECNLCKKGMSIEEFRQYLSKDLFETFQGRIIHKYYKIDYQPIRFYFEEVAKSGTLQNDFANILDRCQNS